MAFKSLTLLLAALLIFSGCDKSTGQKDELKELRLGYFANATHAQAVLGVDSGEYAHAIAPVNLKTKVFNAGPSLIEALFANQIDVGYVGPGPALSGFERSKGQGIRIISGSAANGVVIVARKDSGIESLKDLAGKRVATPQRGNTQDISARHYLTAVLGQKNHDNVIPVANAEQSGMMSRGAIDAAWAPEPWGARLAAETGAKIITEEKDIKEQWPGGQFSLTVIVTTPEFLAKNPQVIEKLLVSHRHWTQQLNEKAATLAPNLDEAIFRLTGAKLAPGVMAAALPRVKFTNEPFPETFSAMSQWSYDLGFSQQQPGKLDSLFDLAILRRLETPAAK